MAEGGPATTTTRYEFTSENAENNIVLYYATDELLESSTVDPLRKELGFEISMLTPEEDDVTSPGPEFSVREGTFEIGIEPLRDINFVKMNTYSPYIEKIEINPSRIVPLSPKSLFPNYSIPVRLYANEANSKGDKFWRTLFVGGEFAGDHYAGLINTETIYNEYFFSFANSYSTLYAKSIGIKDTANSVYEISSIYNSHNINVKEYQEWCTSLGSPLLIPSFYMFETFGKNEGTSSPRGQDHISLALQQYIAITSSNSDFDIDREAISDSLDTIKENFIAQTGKSYLESAYFPKLRATPQAQAIKNVAIYSQKNYMFDSEYYQSDDYEFGEGHNVSNFPFYNIIRFNRHETAANVTPGLGTEYDGLNREKYFIRDAIEDSGFSAKFLETLKDIHEQSWPSVRFGKKRLTSEKSKLVLAEGSEYSTETRKFMSAKNYRTLDLVKMIQTIYNQPSASLNSNYTFIGPSIPSYHTTYEDNKLYRYHDNQNLIQTLDDIYAKIKTKYQFPQTKTTWIAEGESYREYEESGDGDFESLENTQDIMNFIFNPKISHSEVVAYRIEKSGGETFGDYNTTNVVQDYWIFNSNHAGDELKFFDTQVKYAQDYTYKCYAYVAVLGKRYKYSDFRLTKQISLLDQGLDGEGSGVHGMLASDGDIDYYCHQFYEPLSGDFAAQFFNSSESPTLEGLAHQRLNLKGSSMEATFRGDSDRSALGQRNELATDQQGLSMHPQLADFMLHVEPCIKLIEIPLFMKKIKMLDSPANDMVAIPFQYIDNSKRIGFNMRYESFNEMRPYPVSITKEDRRMHVDYLNSRDILPGHDITEHAVAQQRYIEVYRTDKKPTSFADFEGRLVDTIDLKIEDSYYTFPDAIHTTKIPTNKKFYYVFRYVTENLVPGHMSQILECELIDDGDYIYSKFNVLADELSEEITLTEPTKVMKKLLQIEPNIAQISLDVSDVDFTKTSRDQINNLKIGNAQDLLWDQKFKIRLTSKKTGKQLDLNLTYELKDEDRINIESGNAAIQLSTLESDADKFDRLSRLTGRDRRRPGVSTFEYSYDGGDVYYDFVESGYDFDPFD